MPGSILPTLTRATPNLPCTGWLTSPACSEKAASAIAGSMIADLAIVPRSTSDGLSPRSFARSSNDGAGGDAAPRRLGFLDVREHHLRNLRAVPGVDSLSRRSSKSLPGVLVGHGRPFADLVRRDHDKGELADIRARGTGSCGRRNSRPASPARAGRWCRPGLRRA